MLTKLFIRVVRIWESTHFAFVKCVLIIGKVLKCSGTERDLSPMFTDGRWCALLTDTVSTQPIQLQSGRWHFSNPIWLWDAYLWQIMKGEQLLKNWNDPVERSEPVKVLRCRRQVRGIQTSARFFEGSSRTHHLLVEPMISDREALQEPIQSGKLSTIWNEDKQTKQKIKFKQNKTHMKASGFKTGMKLNVASYANS